MAGISPHLRLGNDALSHQVKAGVTPVEKPERRKKGAGKSGLQRESNVRRGQLRRAVPGQSQLFTVTPSGKQPNYRVRVCEGCKQQYKPTSGKQRYCTHGCYSAHAYVEYVCAHCAATFRRHVHGPKRKFCSWKCRDLAKYGEGLMVPCVGCGTEFKKKKSNQKWCSLVCFNRNAQRRRKKQGLTPSQWGLRLKGEPNCRNCGAQAVHLHHIVPRSKSKLAREDWQRNGLPLCVECHRGWHDRAVLIPHRALTDAEFAYAVELTSGLWVERNYPDETLVALHRLDEMVNRRVINPDRPESFDERIERVLGLVA